MPVAERAHLLFLQDKIVCGITTTEIHKFYLHLLIAHSVIQKFYLHLLYSIHTTARVHMWNIIKHNIQTSMNEQIHFFIKIKSLTLYSWKGDVGCVSVMSWRQGQTAILTSSSSDHSSISFSSWLGVAQPWITEGCKLILTLASYLQLTQAARAPGYIIV